MPVGRRFEAMVMVRMARNLAKREPKRTEESLAGEFEAAELLHRPVSAGASPSMIAVTRA